MSQRPLRHPPERDLQEQAWWDEFADVENRFCWVQTPELQRFSRGRYIRQIVDLVPPGGRIAELGCGTGWLSVLLAQMGADRVVGIDFSRAQIALAEDAAASAGVGDRVQFRHATASGLESGGERFELVVMHAFLHHLSGAEIEGVLRTAHRILVDGGVLVMLEPVVYPENKEVPARARRWQRCLHLLNAFLLRFPGRRVSEAEQLVRLEIHRRNVGVAPFGVSPKELPFTPTEISGLLEPWFTVSRRDRVLFFLPQVGQNLLLLQLSHPWIARCLWHPFLRMARRWERLRLAVEPPPSGCWLFELFTCKRSSITAALPK